MCKEKLFLILEHRQIGRSKSRHLAFPPYAFDRVAVAAKAEEVAVFLWVTAHPT